MIEDDVPEETRGRKPLPPELRRRAVHTSIRQDVYDRLNENRRGLSRGELGPILDEAIELWLKAGL